MEEKDKNSLGYLGYNFQIQLLHLLVIDSKFGDSIIGMLNQNYFDNDALRIIAGKIKDYYEQYESVPSFDGIDTIIKSDINNKYAKTSILSVLDEIKKCKTKDVLMIQDKATKFFKQQELKKACHKINKYLEAGDFEKYPECEEIIREALSVGLNKDRGIGVFDSVDDVLRDDFRNPIPTGIEGLDSLMGGGLSKGELGVILAPFGVGKAQGLSSKILTPSGWKTMGEIRVGDFVIGSNGKSIKVLGAFPQGKRPIYKVQFKDKTKTYCDEEHLWSVNTKNQRTRRIRQNGKRYKHPDNTFIPIKTKDLMGNLNGGDGRSIYRIPIIKPVHFNKREVKISPYVLGVLIGDGCITNGVPVFVTKDKDIIKEVKKEHYSRVSSLTLNRSIKTKNGIVNRTIESTRVYDIKDELKKIGLYGLGSDKKFIPKDYLYNSLENRVSLLQGLIDTDGHISNYEIEYSTVSKKLAYNVRELVLSLGGKATIRSKIGTYLKDGERIFCKRAYMVRISFPDNGIIPARCKRKLKNFKPRTKYGNNKFIKKITFSHYEEAQCILVDSKDHLYVTDDYILTHNTTFVTKLANEAYNRGYNVVQIIFEDNPKVIQRKHFSCWTGIDLNKLSEEKSKVKELVNKLKEGKENSLIIKKFSSDGTTIPEIKQYLRKLKSEGINVDMILLDYIDCVQPTKKFKDDYSGEAHIMRQFEAMIAELNIVGWVAIQSNRSGIGADIVDSHMIGGSIKKGQIGHFIVSIAKTLPQKENSSATIAVLKSRFGKDGVIYENIIFDNSKIFIDTSKTTEMSFVQLEQNKKEKEKSRVKELLNE